MKKMKTFSAIIILLMVGFGSLQYMETAAPDLIMDPEDTQHFELPLDSSDYQERGASVLKFASRKSHHRPKRVPEEYINSSNEDWSSNVIYDPITKGDKYVDIISFMDSLAHFDVNGTELTKRSFSPWGGKRNHGNPVVRRLMWTLKQADSPEPSKRVRFIPWGGKRSSNLEKHAEHDINLIYPASALPKIDEFSSSEVKERQFSNWRSPLRILGFDSNNREVQYQSPTDYVREKNPIDYLPGCPYVEMYLKKDGKRNVKFNAWGGKRFMSISSEVPPKDSVLQKLINPKDSLRYKTVLYHSA